MAETMASLWKKIKEEKKWPKPCNQPLVVSPTEGLCKNYRTISLISNSNESILQIMLNRLKRKAGELWGGRAGWIQRWSTV
ncbi:hypothetical protein DPMN_000422 [Dreissena polymorpha]|uniref:Uncharacterized protein n=1 Tax=Dreissena polymorpha TaxID=45954 RepID=A0A9D4MHZ6_DREPO|nr:hypothetical protein DPMN_000422 [Dreissena polymorpha]